MNAEQMKNLSIDYSRQPLEEKTVMFFENYYNGARGVISKIFKGYLSSPLYKDHKFVWVARDYEETLKIFGSLIDDARVWICAVNGHDYVRYLNTAKYIFVAAYLPNFFVKREGQVVYYAPLDFFIHKKTFTNMMLWRLCPTINNADRILAEEKSEEVLDFARRYGISDKLKITDLSIENGTSGPDGGEEEKKRVFLSLTDRKRSVKSLGVFQFVYDTVTSLADAYGYDVYWKISLDLYRKYRDDEMYVIAFKNIYSSEDDCREYMECADIIISDNYTDVLAADKYCENVIFYYNEDVEYEELNTKGKVMYTGDYGRLLDIFEMKLSGQDTIEDTVNMDNVPVLLDCPGELCGDCGYGVTEGKGREEDVEITVPGSLTKVIVVLEITGIESVVTSLKELLDGYKTKMNITVLFCTASGGKLFEYLDDLHTDISYICRAGAIRCSAAEKKEVISRIEWEGGADSSVSTGRAERVLRDEWIRIIGRVSYDHGVAMTGINNFWDNMNRFVPAREVSYFRKKISVDDTVSDIKEALDKITGEV